MSVKTLKKQRPGADPIKMAVTTSQAAALTGYGDERIRQLGKEGWIKKAGLNRFRLVDVVRGALAFKEDQIAQANRTGSAAAVQTARAKEIELRVAREEGRLVSMEDVDAVVSDILGTFRSELDGIPAAASRDLEVRRAVEKHLNAAIDRCRERFQKAQRELASGGEVTLEGDEA